MYIYMYMTLLQSVLTQRDQDEQTRFKLAMNRQI